MTNGVYLGTENTCRDACGRCPYVFVVKAKHTAQTAGNRVNTDNRLQGQSNRFETHVGFGATKRATRAELSAFNDKREQDKCLHAGRVPNVS